MDTWVVWVIQAITGLAIGALGFFLKRTLNRFDKLEEKINSFISSMPFQYTMRDDFIRAVASFDSKLDKILDRLSERNK